MKIVLAPNAFKGSMSASAAAQAMREGVLKALPSATLVLVPVADGGDGLVDVFLNALNGVEEREIVSGPLWEKTTASFCYVPARKMAAIEMAVASGLALLPPEKRDPTLTTTYGTGELIAKALRLGARRITIGIGGSVTTDGGIGVAAALGVRFLDSAGKEIQPIGGNMQRIVAIDMEGLMHEAKEAIFDVACDVDNPLLGETGAARVYGPQKGATAQQVKDLDFGLANLAEVIEKKLGVDVRDIPGAGAAGGLGAGLMAFLGAKLRKGIDLVFQAVALEDQMSGADLVITAEGQIDFQTKFGKAPAGVAALAKKHAVACVAIAGGIGEGVEELHACGITAVFSLCPAPVCLGNAMENGELYLRNVTEQIIRLFAREET